MPGHPAGGTLVLLPGHLCTPALWAAQCAGLADRVRCVALDLDEGDTIDAIADTVLARVPGRFALAGHSMGGHVALSIVRRAPGRVERLALVDTNAAPDTPERRALRLEDLARVRRDGFGALLADLPHRWMHPAHAADPALRARIVAMANACGPQVHRRQQAALMARADSRPALGAIRCPTLVLCGRQDQPNPVSMHASIAAAIPGGRLEIVEDCGHLSPLERPAEVTAALRRWLEAGLG